MKNWISSLLVLSLAFTACTSNEESPAEDEADQVAEIVLAEELSLEKVSFVSEGLDFLYSFEYDKNLLRFLGYPLEGMSENGGAFLTSDGSEIVTSTSTDQSVGLEVDYGKYNVLESEETIGECVYQYRVAVLETEDLTIRSKTCEGQDLDLALKALDVMLLSLTVDEL